MQSGIDGHHIVHEALACMQCRFGEQKRQQPITSRDTNLQRFRSISQQLVHKETLTGQLPVCDCMRGNCTAKEKVPVPFDISAQAAMGRRGSPTNSWVVLKIAILSIRSIIHY